MAKTPPYSPEFKREAVRLYRTGDRSFQTLAGDLGVSRGSLVNWVKHADGAEGLTSDIDAGLVSVISVCGPFGGRVLLEMPIKVAQEIVGVDLQSASLGDLTDATARDIEMFAGNGSELAAGALAHTALAMAREMENPYNSATSKSMCARVLLDVLGQMRALAPEESEPSVIDSIVGRRAERSTGRSAA